MPDLRLIGVHEDGTRLILAGPGGEHYTVTIDDALRTAARRDRPRMGQLQIDIDGGMRPREVQSLIRAGGSTEDVADRAGWSVDKVQRYEGPILAERAHVADQARLVRVRHRGAATAAATAPAPTLQGRVAQRMRERGVDPDTSTSWDAARAPEATTWTVTLTFAAGGRQRQAGWTFDPVLRSVEAVDDEARWLSADDVVVAGPLPASPPRVARVYDVEAEGGVAATTRRATAVAARSGEPAEEPVDLMTAMRQRTTVGRRSGRRRAEPRPVEAAPALPLERPDASGAVERPELPGHEQPGLLDDTDLSSDTDAADDADLEPAGAETPPLEEEDARPLPAPASDEGDDDPVNIPGVAGVASIDAGADVEVRPDSDAAPDADPDRVGPSPAEPAPTEPIPAEPAAGPAVDTAPRSAKRRPRTAVPSWDDIMFGAKRD